MDPLSVEASVTALATSATQICSVISQLRALCKSLPGRLHALNNEVADFELVLTQLALLLEQRKCTLTDSNEMAIPHLLRQARMKLNEAHEIVKRLAIECRASRSTLLGVHSWRKEQERLQMLQDDIRTVKSSLNIMLGASNLQGMMKIRVNIHAMSSTTSSHLALSEKFMGCLTGVDERIAKAEEMLQLQSQQLQANQFKQVRAAYSSKPRLKQQQSFPLSDHKSPTPASRDDFSIHVTPRFRTCRPDCPCPCHAERATASPPIFNTLLGRLFVGYAGLPILSPKCNDEEYRGSRSSLVSMEYWFPSKHRLSTSSLEAM
ncbi:ankyrin repeat protein [Apiospora phragmitis]|uniref:Ankyrin repeat protein n=1 Tax=Apiospora phragmitis TaxID=2905665 RepID=A0ABR1X7B6_9PEZI